MKPQQYIVCFSDHKGKGVKLYGPFVSERLASDFADDLPDPINGAKGVKPMSQFTFHESDDAKAEIMAERHAA